MSQTWKEAAALYPSERDDLMYSHMGAVLGIGEVLHLCAGSDTLASFFFARAPEPRSGEERT